MHNPQRRLGLGLAWFLVLAARMPAAETPPAAEVELRGGQAARQLRVRVAGWKQVVLAAALPSGQRGGHADWGEARLVAAGGRVTYLSDLKPSAVDQPYGALRQDKSHRGGPITIAGRAFERGLGTHAPSEITFTLQEPYEWFEAWVGVDDTAGSQGEVWFTLSNRARGVKRPPWLGEGAAARTSPPFQRFTPGSLRLAIVDLMETFGARYPKGKEFLKRLDAIEGKPLPTSQETGDGRNEAALMALARESLLANPLLDFDRLLVVKRRPLKNGKPVNPDTSFGWDLGLPRSSAGNSALPKNVFDNEIAVLAPVSPEGMLSTLYRPDGGAFVGDVDLDFDAQRLLFSQQDARGRWRLWELAVGQASGAPASRTPPGPARADNRNACPAGLRQISREDQPDVDHYDGCWLPDGRIVFCGTACFQGVPCNFSDVAVLYRMEADGSRIRQLCFEQDHDFNPVVMPSGRVMYLRWEYSDLPHSNARRMFSMNPDGTGQAEYYGSNSYWPNAIFGARPLPGRPGMFVGVVAGHHGSHREGELVLFDVGRGRHEADGAVQRIPGRGKRIEPLVRDQLTAASWPKFAHPCPLSDKHFLVSCKLDERSPWDIYLVDVFDNLLPVCHAEGYALFEPIPLRKTPRPPVLPDKIDPQRSDAVVYLADVYRGPGLSGVPRGAVKRLRLFTYHFAYQGMGGLLGTVGLDGPWDIKRVLGTVPVEADGSALFRVPANTPISVQPLDAEGKALQLMRSWFVGMPGETVTCMGCHEPQSSAAMNFVALAPNKKPEEITPWRGPPRNFSFKREVQPVIDRHCAGCHDGTPERSAPPDLRGTALTSDYQSYIAGNGGGFGGRFFSVGYFELSRYVRRPGIESDMHLLKPCEYHADTTELVRMLGKGHYGVRLDAEAWDRLITWIDLNCPYHGTWTEIGWDPGRQRQRRRELRKLYAGVEEDPEALAAVPVPSVQPLPAARPAPFNPPLQGGPGAGGSPEMRAAERAAPTCFRMAIKSLDLGGGVTLDLVRVPAGEFLMGDPEGDADERPVARIRIRRPFWVGRCEVTNRQFARFDPRHDSRFESKNGYQFGVLGFDLSGPNQPVLRVSWTEAMEFCRWLSRRAGMECSLPTEAQWEYACRAGTQTAFWFGEAAADFSSCANVADAKLRDFATDPYTVYQPLPRFTRYDDWIPRDRRHNDGGLVTTDAGRYRPNPWGLCDMHGNAWEWTRTAYRPYPYDPGDGRDSPAPDGKKVVRGGSWRDRPRYCRSASRWAYAAWQPVYNVGFRVSCAEPQGVWQEIRTNARTVCHCLTAASQRFERSQESQPAAGKQ